MMTMITKTSKTIHEHEHELELEHEHEHEHEHEYEQLSQLQLLRNRVPTQGPTNQPTYLSTNVQYQQQMHNRIKNWFISYKNFSAARQQSVDRFEPKTWQKNIH